MRKFRQAYDAYNALTDEQKAQITGAEIFESLFAFFNGLTNTIETLNNVKYLDENGEEQTADNVAVIDNQTAEWSGGWYVVNSDVEISDRHHRHRRCPPDFGGWATPLPLRAVSGWMARATA